MREPSSDHGVVYLYHPSGVKVALPVKPSDVPGDAVTWAKAMLSDVSGMLEAGWLADAPGVEAGEQVEEVGYVVRQEFEKDGEVTPVILLYSTNDRLEYSFLKKYLNNPADIAAFEAASGMQLNRLPLYQGQDKPKRGASKAIDRIIVKAPKPFKVVLKKNPQYSEEERKAALDAGKTYTKPARAFVRWFDQKPSEAVALNDKHTVEWWKNFLANDPSIDSLNDNMEHMKTIEDVEVKDEVRLLISEHAKACGILYDRDRKEFYRETTHDDPF